MGTGHIMRCIALAQTWQDGGGTVTFICAEIPGALAARIESEGFDLFRIVAKPGSLDDLVQTLNVVQSAIGNRQSAIISSWLVLDGYRFDLDYQRGIRVAGHKLLLIDDHNHRPEYECDILLNQNINAAELDYSINPDAQMLFGTQYALLRREFQCLEKTERDFPNIGKNVLVTLGGADPDNVTLRVIEALQKMNMPNMCTKVVVGPANPHMDSLQQFTSLSTRNCHLISSVRNMPELMQWADLAVSAGGSTCWELCCLGVPFLSVVLAENQRGLTAELDRKGIAACLGERPTVEGIMKGVSDLADDEVSRSRRAAAGRELVDGLGALRVLRRPAEDAGLNLLAGKVRFRPALSGDMDQFWFWANDPSVRSQCYSSEPIPIEAHQRWFCEKQATDNTLMLVLELCGQSAGQIRYDRHGNTAKISFSIDRRFRGLGLGMRIVEQTLGRAFAVLGVDSVRAEVFQSNLASLATFQKTGFELAEKCEIKGIPSVIFVKKRV